MWSIIFKEITKFKIISSSQALSMVSVMPLLIINVVKENNWSFVAEYIVLALFALLCLFISNEVPQTLYLCPLTKNQRMKYVTYIFWLRILVGNIAQMGTAVCMVITDFMSLPFACLLVAIFFMNSLFIGFMDFINSYQYCTDLFRFGAFVILIISMLEMFVILDGKHIGWNIETISGGIVLIFMLWFNKYLMHRFYRLMINVCSDYELSSKKLDPYRTRKVSRAR